MRLELFLIVVVSLGLVGSAGALPGAANGSSGPSAVSGPALWSDTTRSTHAQGEPGEEGGARGGVLLAGAVLSKGNPGEDTNSPPGPEQETRSAFVTGSVSADGDSSGTPAGIPEPNTMILLGAGLLVLAGIGRRFTRT